MLFEFVIPECAKCINLILSSYENEQSDSKDIYVVFHEKFKEVKELHCIWGSSSLRPQSVSLVGFPTLQKLYFKRKCKETRIDLERLEYIEQLKCIRNIPLRTIQAISAWKWRDLKDADIECEEEEMEEKVEEETEEETEEDEDEEDEEIVEGGKIKGQEQQEGNEKFGALPQLHRLRLVSHKKKRICFDIFPPQLHTLQVCGPIHIEFMAKSLRCLIGIDFQDLLECPEDALLHLTQINVRNVTHPSQCWKELNRRSPLLKSISFQVSYPENNKILELNGEEWRFAQVMLETFEITARQDVTDFTLKIKSMLALCNINIQNVRMVVIEQCANLNSITMQSTTSQQGILDICDQEEFLLLHSLVLMQTLFIATHLVHCPLLKYLNLHNSLLCVPGFSFTKNLDELSLSGRNSWIERVHGRITS